MDKYDPQKRVGLIVDEWGAWHDVEPGTNPGFLYQQNSLRDALVAGLTLNIFNNHCDRVQMANIAQTVNVLQAMILTDRRKMMLTPTYHVFEMYKVHHDATLLPTELAGPEYAFEDGKVPALNVSASRDGAGKVHVSLGNLDPHNAVADQGAAARPDGQADQRPGPHRRRDHGPQHVRQARRRRARRLQRRQGDGRRLHGDAAGQVGRGPGDRRLSPRSIRVAASTGVYNGRQGNSERPAGRAVISTCPQVKARNRLPPLPSYLGKKPRRMLST